MSEIARRVVLRWIGGGTLAAVLGGKVAGATPPAGKGKPQRDPYVDAYLDSY